MGIRGGLEKFVSEELHDLYRHKISLGWRDGRGM